MSQQLKQPAHTGTGGIQQQVVTQGYIEYGQVVELLAKARGNYLKAERDLGILEARVSEIINIVPSKAVSRILVVKAANTASEALHQITDDLSQLEQYRSIANKGYISQNQYDTAKDLQDTIARRSAQIERDLNWVIDCKRSLFNEIGRNRVIMRGKELRTLIADYVTGLSFALTAFPISVLVTMLVSPVPIHLSSSVIIGSVIALVVALCGAATKIALHILERLT